MQVQSGIGFDILKNPEKYFRSLSRYGSTPTTTQSLSLAPTKENEAKRAAQAQSKAASQSNEEKKNSFGSIPQTSETTRTRAPLFGNTYDSESEQRERLQRFGIPTTDSPDAYQNGDTFKIIKEGGATVQDYLDFFEGFRSIDDDNPTFWLNQTKKTLEKMSKPKERRMYYYNTDGSFAGKREKAPEYVQAAVNDAKNKTISDRLRRNLNEQNADWGTLATGSQGRKNVLPLYLNELYPEKYTDITQGVKKYPYEGKNRHDELYGEHTKEGLDVLSTALAVASVVPGLDTFMDLAAIPVDLIREDYVSAGLDLIGAVPFVGEPADEARLAKLGFEAADAIKDADNAVDMARAVDKAGTLVKTIDNVGELAKPYSKDKVPKEVNRYLSRLLKYGDSIEVDIAPSLENISLLSRQEAVEFVSITVGNRNIIIRGDIKGAYIPENILNDMVKNKGILNCHSHPYIGDLRPSQSDLWLAEVLSHQKTFKIVTPDWQQAVYTKDGVISVENIPKSISEKDVELYLDLFGG